MIQQQSIEDEVWRIPGRGARLLVDLDRLEGNVATIVQHISPSAQVMAVVKAGGYGHGGAPAAKAAIAGGATWLGVATISEGAALRQAGITAPILILGPTMPAEAVAAHANRLSIAIGSGHQAAAVCRELEGVDLVQPLGVHLKINSGMNRYGVHPAAAAQVAKAISEAGEIGLEGAFTHFACADNLHSDFTQTQASVFAECVDELDRAKMKPALVHASNSAAMLRFREYDFDMVRPGIAIYGVRPAAGVELFPGMHPVLSVKAIVQRVESLQSGEATGYGGAYVAASCMEIGLLSLGYGDGYPRSLSNRGWVGFRGARLPVTGRVSMDQTTISIPDGTRVEVGDLVSVVGDGSAGEPAIDEIAEIAGTIPYEIMTGLGLRLPTYCHRSGAVVANNDSSTPGSEILIKRKPADQKARRAK